MDTINNPDDAINVEEIMQKIRENIKKRKDLMDNGDAKDAAVHESNVNQEMNVLGDEAQKDLAYINSNWDIQNNSYFISSHRRTIGKAFTRGRELVHGEVRRYIDPMIWKQKDFNSSLVRIINKTTKEIGGIYSIIGEPKGSIDQLQVSISAQIDQKLTQSETKLSSEIREQVMAVVASMNEEIENRVWLAGILDKKISKSMGIQLESSNRQDSGINYFVFEERFRGSRADIKGRQSAFIKYFEGCKNVLDIGCGRGEFLEILKERSIAGQGIDLDEDMVNFCRSRGLNVELIDAVSHLDKLEDESLDGIFIDQVVEHLDPDYLIRLLGLCYKKLIYGAAIVVETVNPLSFFSFANFYIDMSHKRPVHPETLRFLLASANFRDIEAVFVSPVSEGIALKKIIKEEPGDRDERLVGVYNQNIELLNNILFGPQDYVLIGKK